MPDAPSNPREIFLAAVDRQPDERRAFLEQACGHDAALKQRVEALLRAHDVPGEFLGERPPGPEHTRAYVPGEAPGVVIAGRYKLLEAIGEGGMGTVWVAEQTEPVRRKVALKLIKAGMDSKSVIARFEAERQALAVMDHPNVARVLDGGLTETGRPFFVMEFVKGVPITEYCDAAKLNVPERLQLFAQVCQAVQHAHQKGIIHRDLKPSNVLVAPYDDKPVPKIIDFGLAKAIHQALTDKTLNTAHDTVLGTPLYMSPEQAQLNNLDVDTRSDIYSLGVLLYELLTGTTPVEQKRFKQAAWEEMRRIIREEEPPRPSARLSSTEALPSLAACRQTEPLKLTKQVRGELDWIVMKALDKDRARRYETANGFAADVLRYLSGDAVQAHPPSPAYRLKKFVKRNRGPVLAASLVLLALVAGVIGTTLGLIEAQHQAGLARAESQKREEARLAEAAQRMIAVAAKEQESAQRVKAEQARDRTRQALDAMTSSITRDSLTTQTDISAEQQKFLTEVLTYYQEFADEKAEDALARARTAAAAYRVGVIESQLGKKAEAVVALGKARDGYQKLAAELPAVREYRQGLARSYNQLGVLLNDLGKRAEAEEQYRLALTIEEKLAADFPAVAQCRQDLAASHANLGDLLNGLGRQAEAEEQNRHALAIREKLAADFPVIPVYRRDLAGSLNNLGNLLSGLARRAEAEEQYRQALAIREKLAAESPDVPQYRQDLAASHLNLGLLLSGLGKRAEAEEQYRQALAIQLKLAAEFPVVPVYRQHLAESYVSFGSLLGTLGKRAEADEQYRRALAIQEKLAVEFPDLPRCRQDLARSRQILGSFLDSEGKRAEAEEQYRQALAIQLKLAAEFPVVPAYRRDLADSYTCLGALLQTLGKQTEAEEQYRRALAIQERLAAEFPDVPAYQISLGGSYCNIGNLTRDSSEAADSLKWYGKAIGILTPVHRREPRDVLASKYLRNSYKGRATAYEQLGKYADAIADVDKAIEVSPPEDKPSLRARRATSRLRAGQVAEAVAEVEDLTNHSDWNAVQWYNFARVYAVASSKIPDKKQPYADRAAELLQKAVKAGFKNAGDVKKNTDLDPLRDRDDFKKLLADLEKPAEKE